MRLCYVEEVKDGRTVLLRYDCGVKIADTFKCFLASDKLSTFSDQVLNYRRLLEEHSGAYNWNKINAFIIGIWEQAAVTVNEIDATLEKIKDFVSEAIRAADYTIFGVPIFKK